MPKIALEENRFFKYVLPILCAGLLTLAGIIYHQDQSRQDNVATSLQTHQDTDETNFIVLTKQLTILNSNVYQLCVKTKASCQDLNGSISLLTNATK